MSNRSGSPYSAPRDANHVPLLAAASTSDGITPVVLEADPVTHLLQVSSSGGGGGTQYTDAGTPPAHPVGTMPIFNNAGTWSQVSNSAGLPVNIVGGSSSGTQYTQGGATVANPTGNAEIWFDGSGNPKAVTPSQPLPSNLTDGTNIANVVAGTTGNALQTAGTALSVPFTTTTAQAVGTTDAGDYSYVAVQITSQGTSSNVTFQVSNDNSNWLGLTMQDLASSTQASSTGVTTRTWGAPLPYRYFRLNVTGISAGTTAGTILFSSLPRSAGGVIAYQGTAAWSVGANSSTGSATPGTAFYQAGSDGANLVGLQVRNPGDSLNPIAGTLMVHAEAATFNGTTWDRVRSATSAANTTGTGLLGAAALGFDGTNYQRITVNSTTTTSKFGADANILSILGTAPTTAGKLDIKGADGDVFVRQTTASNLNMTAFGYDGSTQRALSTTTGGILITENGATAAAVPTAATYQAGNAATALPAAATVGNLTGAMYDKFGRQVVLPNAQRDLVLPMTQLTLTATTTETSLIGAVASIFNDILSLVVINTSATATQVDFRDSTAGTIRLSLYVPAGDTRGISLTTPMPQAAVNTAWTAKCGTSVSSVIITGTYISNK